MLDVPMESLMEIVKIEAQSMIGEYQKGWAPLAERTIEEKLSLGYGEDPLLREGTLRDSIEADAELSPGGATGVVGSDDEVALYQEMGTPNAARPIPPRPFLATAMIKADPSAERLFGEFLVRLISGLGVGK